MKYPSSDLRFTTVQLTETLSYVEKSLIQTGNSTLVEIALTLVARGKALVEIRSRATTGRWYSMSDGNLITQIPLTFTEDELHYAWSPT